jgi:HSP20 family protein
MTNEETTKQVAPRRDFFGLSDMREEMDRLWEAMVGRGRPFQYFNRMQQIPVVDVFEKDGQLHIRAEVPGIEAQDVQIEVEDGSLLISGEKKEEKEVKEENYYRAERSYGKFSRRLPLPKHANPERAEARFKDGILEIDMPLNGEAPRKKIEVKGGSA